MRGILLAGRRFEQARRFTASHPDAGLSALPAFEDPLAGDAQAPVWRMNAEGNRLPRTAIELAPTQHLVTAACHLPLDAPEALSDDPVPGPHLPAHSPVLVRPP